MPRKNRLFIILVLVLNAVDFLHAQTEEAAARQIFDLLNGERVQAGLLPLVWNHQLAQTAVAHSQRMAEQGRLAHEFSGEPRFVERLAGADVRFDRSGENVGLDVSARDAHEGFMLSPPHRANILSPEYTAGGIGVVRKGEHLYVTENFAHLIVNASNEQFAEELASSLDRLRRDAGLRPLRRISRTEVPRLACDMAHAASLDASKDHALPDARVVARFTATDPSQLPASVQRLSEKDTVKSFAVGACFGRGLNHPGGVYWALIVFYSSEGVQAGPR